MEIDSAIEEMPTISPIVAKLQEFSRNIHASPRDLVHIIMLDPVITGKVIKLVNSSFFGLPNKVFSLAQAVVLLGMNTVKNLAMSSAVLGTMFLKETSSALVPEEFWRHSMATAVGCKLYALKKGVPRNDLEIYFIAGLLHDIGKVVLIKANPEAYAKAVQECRQLGISLYFAELAHYGFSHADAGGKLARKWQLDPPLTQAIAHHHMPRQQEHLNPLLSAVIIMNNLSKEAALGTAGNPVIEEFARQLASQEGLDGQALESIKQALPRQLATAEVFLKITKEDSAA